LEWWIAVAVLLLNICENSMSAVYTERVIQRNRFLAALIGSHIDLIGTISVVAYTNNIYYLLPLFLGSFAGTYLGTYLNPHISQWLLNRERRRNLKKANAVRLEMKKPG
jgi:hypothetical protein